MTDTPRVRPERRQLGPLPVAVLLGMLALTAAVAVGVWHYQAGQEQQTRQEWAQRGARELNDQVSQTGAALLGVRGLFAASTTVEKPEFMRFAAIQLGRSTLLGLSWTPRVPAAARGRFERTTGLRILDRAPDGSYRPAGVRPLYFPVRFLAPETPEGTRALGLDSLATVVTPAAVGIARDGGELALSSPIQLGLLPTAQGTALLLAIYRTGAPFAPSRSGGPPWTAS